MNIRAAVPADYDALAQIWLESWYSTGLKSLFDPGPDMLQIRIPDEVAKGWALYTAEERGAAVAMLALKPNDSYLDQLWVAPAHQGAASAGRFWLSRAKYFPTRSGCVVSCKMKMPGAGMSAKASASKARKSFRLPICG